MSYQHNMPRQQQQPQQPKVANNGEALFTQSFHFSELPIDKNVLYRDFSQKASPYSYVTKIIEMNRKRLALAHNLKSVAVLYEQSSINFQADSQQSIDAAIQSVTTMLQWPLLSMTVDPDIVVALRVFKDMKKDFSAQTSCWMHFVWVSRTVTCYGLDAKPAQEYLNIILRDLRACMDSPDGDAEGRIVVDKQFDRRVSKFIKKSVDNIELWSGTMLAIKSESIATQTVTAQLYGLPVSIQQASNLIEQYSAALASGVMEDIYKKKPKIPRSLTDHKALARFPQGIMGNMTDQMGLPGQDIPGFAPGFMPGNKKMPNLGFTRSASTGDQHGGGFPHTGILGNYIRVGPSNNGEHHVPYTPPLGNGLPSSSGMGNHSMAGSMGAPPPPMDNSMANAPAVNSTGTTQTSSGTNMLKSASFTHSPYGDAVLPAPVSSSPPPPVPVHNNPGPVHGHPPSHQPAAPVSEAQKFSRISKAALATGVSMQGVIAFLEELDATQIPLSEIINFLSLHSVVFTQDADGNQNNHGM